MVGYITQRMAKKVEKMAPAVSMGALLPGALGEGNLPIALFLDSAQAYQQLGGYFLYTLLA